MTKLNLNDRRLRYDGRIDRTNPNKPMFTWPGCLVTFRYIGRGLAFSFTEMWDWGVRTIGLVADGKEYQFPLKDKEASVDLPEGEHEIFIYKTGENNFFTLDSIEIDGELLDNPTPEIGIEVYGDSVSAGSVVDCEEYVGKNDPPHTGQYDNAWHAYPLMLSRKLPARVFVTSQGGIAIFDKTGYFMMPNMVGMESCWDKMGYTGQTPITKWDFSFKPDFIIFAIGQNDHNPWPDCLKDADYREKWVAKYAEIVENVRANSPKAKVIFAMTLLMHDPIWDEALDEVAARLGGDANGVYRFMYTRCGKATPGHPRISEQAEMAEEMAAFIKELANG